MKFRPESGDSPRSLPAAVSTAIQYAALCMAALQLARLAALLTLGGRLAQSPVAAIARSWLLGLRYDAAATATFIGLPVVLLALPCPARFERWWRPLWHAVTAAAIAALVFLSIADYYFLQEVQRHMGQEALAMSNDVDFIGAFALGPGKWGLCLLAAALLVIGWVTLRLAKSARRGGTGWQALGLALVMVLAVRGSVSSKPLSAIDAFDAGSYDLAQLELDGAFSVVRALDRDTPPVRQRDVDQALGSLGYAQGSNPFARHASGAGIHNVVVMLLESWSASYVDAFRRGSPLQVTPEMDRLAGEGLRFDEFYAAGQRSYEGLQAALTGLPALPGVPTLTEGLMMRTTRVGALAGRNGLRTIFMQTSKRRSLRLDSVAQALGFGEYYGREDVARALLPYPDADAFRFGLDYESLQLLADKLHGEQRPFMVYLFTGSTHAPLASPPAAQRSRYPEGYPDKPFLDAIHYSDWSIGRFMERARREPWFDNTVFIFTADHTRGTDKQLRDRFRIPLVIYAPRIVAPRVDTRVASQVDIFDTVIGLIGVNGDYSSFGRSLLAGPVQDRAIFRSGENVGIVTPDQCFMYTPQAQGGAAAYLAAYRTLLYGVVERNGWVP
jgi:phosphoglycerol transferase MdoB-like AlkP superfamily enzyme